MRPEPSRARYAAFVLLLSIPIFVLVATACSETGMYPLARAMRAIFAQLGLMAPEAEHELLRLRLLRAICAAGVGGALALAGAMAQGLFRNPLADPNLLGIGSGASLGAMLGIAILGGYGSTIIDWRGGSSGGFFATYGSLALVPVLAMVGALATALPIYRLATRAGRISIPTLLLTGLAVNAILGAVMATIQVLLLADWQVARAILSWGFGTFDDRTAFHAAIVWAGAAVALVATPFVSLELDLMAGGEEDAAALGADPVWIKTLVLSCVALSTASAVAVSGQIAFIGLIVPHAIRTVVGPHHRSLLPLSFLAGSALVLAVLVFQHAFCPWLAGLTSGSEFSNALYRLTALQPGVITSLLGAPFFLYLMLRTGGRQW